ncbi:ZIP family metal transporter [Candidatus Mycosynbacter amalyticus]|uniref:ZIP family metal transporter n=1 Tax=Candidatus Mycosynbacter amalyticus TaxID=2665156 RepID=A0A857MQU4_9BACT|nr:ZIP family metal transporter [Candidatus Mycosynbacter amalyticus]QHN43000.1 ZIP family metal transporter [Candidatus Mycosynbacter amalyticus]
MNEWILLLIAAIFGSVISLAGGVYLLYGKWGVDRLQRVSVPFAAGALLAAAFVDLLPEAMEGSDTHVISLVVLTSFLVFFLLERSLSWFHHHHEHEHANPRYRRNSSLIVIGDTLHNFIDGLAIGASFLVSPVTGIITTIAITAHEIPQEIGDFGLLLAKGMKKRNVVLANLLSALATVVGAVLVYALGGSVPISEPILLAITAGFFIYIAASDIIPTIHAEPKRRTANIQAAVLLLGVLFVGVTTTLAHDMIGGHEHDATEQHTH